MKLIFSLFIVNAVLDKCFAGGGQILFLSLHTWVILFSIQFYIYVYFLGHQPAKERNQLLKDHLARNPNVILILLVVRSKSLSYQKN